MFYLGRSEELPKFVDKDLMESYSLNEEGKTAARIILQILDFYRPDITYAPMLYSITCLLLHYMEPEKVNL